MKAWMGFGWLVCGACAAAPAPQKASPMPAPPPVTPPPIASTPRPGSAPPENAASASKPIPPACIPPELRAEGRIFAARIDQNENFSFCVRKGVGSEAPTRCLELAFAEKKFKGLADVWPGMSFFTIIEAENAPVSAEVADNAGTLEVCAGPDCTTLRIHPPKRGAFDEVFGLLPAISVPGSSRVLIARLQETWPKNGPSNPEVFIDAVDVKKKAKLASRSVAKGEWPAELTSIGKKALLKSCKREADRCSARVVDPQTLAATRLKIDLPADAPRGADAGSAVQRTASGETLLVDASGATALWLSAEGAVSRHVELGPPAPDSEMARVGRRNAREVVVLRAGPHAGNVVLIGLEDGNVARFDAPVCP